MPRGRPRKSATSGKTDKERYLEEQKQKKDILKLVQSPDSFMEKVDKLGVSPINDPLRLSEDAPKPRRLYTKTALDRILSIKGGIPAGRSVELFGEFGSGKTQIINTMLVESEGLCILIDTEHTFDPDRFKELCEARGKDPADVNERLLLYQPLDWIEQIAIIRNLPQFDKDGNYLDVGIVAVDSLMKLFGQAPELSGRANLSFRQSTIGQMLAMLRTYAKRHNSILVWSSQIRSRPVNTMFAAPESKVASQGGPTVSHEGDYRIFLRKGPRNIRYARLVDSIDLPLMEVPFILDVSGIRDIPDPGERLKAMEQSEEYGKKFLSARLGNTPPGKKYYMEALRRGVITPEEAKQYLDEKDIAKVLMQIDPDYARNADSEIKIEEIVSEEDVPPVEEVVEEEVEEIV